MMGQHRPGHMRGRLPAGAGAVVTSVLLTVGISGMLPGAAASAAAYPAHPAAARPTGTRMAMFAAAATESGVPARLLLALSYNESRWQPHGASPSADHGYGLMDLTSRVPVAGTDRGDPARPAPGAAVLTKTNYTLDEAS